MVTKEQLNKSLKVSEQTYKKLNDYKIVPEETFNSVIKKLIKGELNEDNNKKAVETSDTSN